MQYMEFQFQNLCLTSKCLKYSWRSLNTLFFKGKLIFIIYALKFSGYWVLMQSSVLILSSVYWLLLFWVGFSIKAVSWDWWNWFSIYREINGPVSTFLLFFSSLFFPFYSAIISSCITSISPSLPSSPLSFLPLTLQILLLSEAIFSKLGIFYVHPSFSSRIAGFSGKLCRFCRVCSFKCLGKWWPRVGSSVFLCFDAHLLLWLSITWGSKKCFWSQE